MPQDLTGLFADQPGAGQTKQRVIDAAPPVLVGVAEAGIRLNTVGTAVYGDLSPEEGLDALTVPVAVQCVKPLKQGGSQNSGMAGHSLLKIQIPGHLAGIRQVVFAAGCVLCHRQMPGQTFFAAKALPHLHHQRTGCGAKGGDGIVPRELQSSFPICIRIDACLDTDVGRLETQLAMEGSMCQHRSVIRISRIDDEKLDKKASHSIRFLLDPMEGVEEPQIPLFGQGSDQHGCISGAI